MGSSTSLEQSLKNGHELADLFNHNGLSNHGEPFTCGGCIAGSPDLAGEMAKVIAKHGTEQQFLNLLEIYDGDDSAKQAAKEAYVEAKGGQRKLILACSSPEVCAIAMDLHKNGVSAKKAAEKTQADLIMGGAVSLSNNGGTEVLPFAQGGFKHALNDKFSFNVGASLRPETEVGAAPDGVKFNPLELNISQKTDSGWNLIYGLSTTVANHNYARDPFSAGSTLSCGCSGIDAAAEIVPMREGVFSPVLNEFSIAGVHAEKTFNEKTHFRASAGVAVNSEILQEGKPAALVSVRHKLGEKSDVSATVAVQEKQSSFNLGASRKLGENTKASATIYHHDGEINRTGVEAKIEKQKLFNIKKLAGALIGVFEKDHDRDQDNWSAGPAVEYKLSERSSIGARAYHGKRGGREETGAVGFFSIKF